MFYFKEVMKEQAAVLRTMKVQMSQLCDKISKLPLNQVERVIDDYNESIISSKINQLLYQGLGI